MLSEKSLKSMVESVWNNAKAREAGNYQRGRIHLYIYLFLLHEIQGYSSWQAFPTIREMLASVTLPDDIRNGIKPFAETARSFSGIDFSRCSPEAIRRYFKRTYDSFIHSHSTTSTSPSLYRLIEFLLAFSPDDSFADFYGNDHVCRYVSEKKLVKSATCFEPQAEDWLFDRMYRRLFGEKASFHYKQLDIADGRTALGRRFSKIYAFPPFYRKIERADSASNVRIVRNMQRGDDDRSEILVQQVLACLKTEGRALILLSNAMFTRNYAAFQKKIIEDRYLTKIINLPFATVYPKNINASFLLFEKTPEKNKGVLFVDLRSLGPDPKKLSSSQSAFDFIDGDSIETLLSPKKSKYACFVSYSDIADTGYDLNSNNYIGKEKPTSHSAEDDWMHVAEQRVSFGGINKAFVLGNEVQILRGMQDMDAFTILAERDASEEAVSNPGKERYLRISDIEGNRIQDTMPYIRWKRNGYGEKFRLCENDIVLSKTAIPVKIAVLESGDGYPSGNIYPAGNIFIVRLKEGSELNRYYLKCYLESDEGMEKLRMLSSGSSLASFTKASLSKLEIPFKSYEQQRLIEREYRQVEREIKNLEDRLVMLRRARRDVVAHLLKS